MSSSSSSLSVNRWRYLRVLSFFVAVILDVIWWEIVLRRLLGRKVVSRRRTPRLQQYSHRFRVLAVRLGGVMIKLGQFISARIDVIPEAIIDELAGLQDEVPPDPIESVLPDIEASLGGPVDTVFISFDQTPVAAASLGQVYRASRSDGRKVVVKVLRPHIEEIVQTDLRALAAVARWVMWWPLIRRRADVPALLEEFGKTLYEELDYVQEAANAARFKQLLVNDHRVYIPAVHEDLSGARVLVLQDVTSIKISDVQAIEAAGIDRAVLARRLLDVYLKMIFDFDFFHADPHPGNLFVYPLSADVTQPDVRPGGQPFYLIFVDFGMVGRITEEMRDGLREGLIAVATRDGRRIARALQMLDVLLPGADVERIAQAEEEGLNMVWGKSVPELANMPRSEMREMAHKYRDLMFEMPFQVPHDFIYLGRALGMLSGMCTMLDPAFNPWAQVANYTQRLVRQEARHSLPALADGVLNLGQTALGLPNRLLTALEHIETGKLDVRVAPTPDLDRSMRRLERAIGGLTRAVVFAGLMITGALLHTGDTLIPAYAVYGAAGLVAAGSLVRLLVIRRE